MTKIKKLYIFLSHNNSGSCKPRNDCNVLYQRAAAWRHNEGEEVIHNALYTLALDGNKWPVHDSTTLCSTEKHLAYAV
jgi:hypothetical protein